MELKIGLKSGQKNITAWAKTGVSDSMLAIRKMNVNPRGLKFAGNLKCDTVNFIG